MRHLLKKRINTFEALNQNKYVLTNSILLKQELSNALLRKDIIASTLNISQTNNNIAIVVDGFTRTSKLLKYRKLLKNNTSKIFKQKKGLNTLITRSFNNTLKTNNILITYNNLNKIIDKNLLLKNFKTFKKFSSILFTRGFNLFLDFLKVITLIEQKKIAPKTLLVILGQIFKNSNKRKHSRFVFFIKTIFDVLVPSTEILGMKLIINGRIMGKTRASTVKIAKGSLVLNTVNAGCVHDKMHVYTLYGAFGFKLWINYKN